eukprot:s3316_g4.t1
MLAHASARADIGAGCWQGPPFAGDAVSASFEVLGGLASPLQRHTCLKGNGKAWPCWGGDWRAVEGDKARHENMGLVRLAWVAFATLVFGGTQEDHLSPALASDDDCLGAASEGACHLNALQRRVLKVPNVSNSSGVAASLPPDLPTPPPVPSSSSPLPTTSTPQALQATEPVANTTVPPATTSTTPPPPVSVCLAGQEIPFSDRKPGNECVASKLGDECSYQCNEGYIAVGRHVCQTIVIQNKVWKDKSFFGGNCWRLCAATSGPCPAGQVPLRVNTTDDLGPCMQTLCKTEDDAFKNLARGNYEVWRRSRNDYSGCYTDHIDLDTGKAKLGSSDTTGMGIIMECIAHSMGWISDQDLLERVNLTLSSYANIPPPAKAGMSWNFTRGPKGWVPRYFQESTGALLAEAGDKVDGVWSVMSTGLFYVGVMFVQTYVLNHWVRRSDTTGMIARLTEKLMDMVDWHSMLCLQAFASPDVVEGYNGTGIPMLMNNNGLCTGISWPEADGYYPFTEEIAAAWLADRIVCGHRGQENCSMPAIHTMWNKVVGRALHPNLQMFGHPLLSDWSSYVVQIPYYTTHPVNSFPAFQKLFKDGWLADWADYNSSVFYGGSDRYGMGAGPDIMWCSGKEYNADMYTNNTAKGDCRTWSPEAVAGWLPASPEVIKGHLLSMMANGESVLPVPGTDYHILWRKAMVDPGKNWSSYVTLIDLSTELLGLSTIWLGAEWYRNNTNHFTSSRGYIPEVPI